MAEISGIRKNVEEVLPWLYLKGISTGDFKEALQALLGVNAKGLSASTISRCKKLWEQEHDDWSRRNLGKSRYVYFWADGVYFNIRSDDARQCILVIIGVTEQGRKEFVAVDVSGHLNMSFAELDRTFIEAENTRFEAWPQTGSRRWGSGLLEGNE